MPRKRKAENPSDSGPGSSKRKLSDNKTTEPSAKIVLSALDLKSLLTDKSWSKQLSEEFDKAYFRQIEKQLAKDFKDGKTVFPPQNEIFNAFSLTPFEKVNVVILGQDPYHDDGQAHGLSFSVKPGVKFPPSLKNIFKELQKEYGKYTIPENGSLEAWAKQGILLLNATLTVEAHKANSHSKYGWLKFTDSVLQAINEKKSNVVFILWGGFAHKKASFIDVSKHTVIKTAHPSPLSFSKFLGCNCFKLANEALANYGKPEIDWQL